MAIKYVMFDLDGTLLPMDQDVFVSAYFKGLAQKMAPYGYEAQPLIKAVWAGTAAMIKNDGTDTNEEVFWKEFSRLLGPEVRKTEPILTNFYENEFQQVQQVCGFAPEAAKVVESLKEKGICTVLATNPIFPRVGTYSRIRWAGLVPEDFAHVTVYENSRHTKPNLDYYRDILRVIGADPSECLMVGNDVGEDMVAQKLGMQVFLLTDCLINKTGEDISQYPNGSFDALEVFLEKL